MTTWIDINDNAYTNSELEEMGLPVPHDCRVMDREYDEHLGTVHDICVECGYSIIIQGVTI